MESESPLVPTACLHMRFATITADTGLVLLIDTESALQAAVRPAKTNTEEHSVGQHLKT